MKNLSESILKNLSESILYNIHKSEEINVKQLKLFKESEESGEIDDFLSRKLDTICNKVRTSRQTILRYVNWKPAGENSFYIMPEFNDYYVSTSKDKPGFEKRYEKSLASLEGTIRAVATRYFPGAEVYKEGNWYMLKLDEDEVNQLAPKTKKNPRYSDEFYEDCSNEYYSENFQAFIKELNSLYKTKELFNDGVAENLIKKYNLKWLYFRCAHCNKCDKVRVSDLQKIFQADSLVSALEDLYIITVGGGDGLLCWPCAQDEK